MQNKTKYESSCLTKKLVNRIVTYKLKLKEVETISMKETIQNFERDLSPEREVSVWEQIADMYVEGCNSNPNWKLSDKKQHYRTVFGRSLGING